jgi:UDP-glucose 4-epimerase
MKYVVTGGAGFIGSHLTEKLIEDGHTVSIVDNLNTGKEKNLEAVKDKIQFFKGSILDYELLDKMTHDVDGVFHQAALASVQDSFTKPDEYQEVNVIGTKNIFELSRRNNFKVVYASSSSVYGNPEHIPIKESDAKNPFNPYAKTKLKDEELAVDYASKGAEIIGLRYFNVFGKRQSKEYAGVIKLFLDQIKKKESPIVNGDGTQFRDFVHVSDVVNANILSMNSKIKHAFYNVGTNSSITILDLAKSIIRSSGLELEPKFRDALKGDVDKTLSDISLIQKEIQWKPTIRLEDWLKMIITSNEIDEV